MTLTRYDATFLACVAGAWFIIGSIEFLQTIVLATLFVLMFFAGERKEAQRVNRLIKRAAL